MSDSEGDVTDKQIKIVFIGDASVGKTCLVRRFCYDEFNRQYTPTVGVDFHIKRQTLPDQNEIVLKILDIGGHELTGNMLDKYLFNCDAVVLVYDITNLSSFESMTEWISRVRRIAIEPTPLTAIIGNKCDMEHQRAVRLDRTRRFAERHSLIYGSVSARTGESVLGCVMDLVTRLAGDVAATTTPPHYWDGDNVVRAELQVPTTAERVRPAPATMPAARTTLCAIQ